MNGTFVFLEKLFVSGKSLMEGDPVGLHSNGRIYHEIDPERVIGTAKADAMRGDEVWVKNPIPEIEARPWLVAADLGLYKFGFTDNKGDKPWEPEEY